MADEIIIPISLQVDPQTLAEEQEKVLRAFNQAVKPGAPSFDAMRQILQQGYQTPADVGQLRGGNPAFARAADAWNKFAQTGQTDAQQRAQARADQQAQRQQDQQIRQQRQQELLLLRQLNQQRQSQLSLAQSAARAFNIAQSAAMFGSGRGHISPAGMLYQLGSLAINAGLFSPSGAGTAAAQAAAAQASKGAPTAGAPSTASAAGLAAIPGQIVKTTQGVLEQIAGAIPGWGKLLVGIAAAGLAEQTLSAQQAGAEQALAGSAAGVGGGAMLRRALSSSVGYLTPLGPTAATYETLGRMGVGGPNIENTANAALAFSRITGLDLGQVTQFAGQLATGGRMSPEAVGQFFDAVTEGASRLGLSMTKLTDSMSDFTKATGDTALGLRGQLSLLAVQGVLGNAIPVSAAAPFQNATGTQAYRMAGFLGVSVDQLAQWQQGGAGGMATMLDLYNRRLRAAAGGGTLQQRITNAAIINQALGGYDVSKLGFSEQQQLFTLALQGAPAQFEQAYNRLIKQVTPSAAAIRQQGRQVAEATTPPVDKAEIQMVGLLQQILEAIRHPSSIGLPGPPIITPRTGAGEAPGQPLSTLPGTHYAIDLPDPYGGRAVHISGANAASLVAAGKTIQGMDTNAATNMLATLAAYESASSGYPPGGAPNRLTPSARNPQSGAVGAFQFLPSTIAGFEAQPGSPVYGMKTLYDPSGRTRAGYFNPYNFAQESKLAAYYVNQLLAANQGNLYNAIYQYSGSNPAEAAYVSQDRFKANITITVVDKTHGGVQATAQGGIVSGAIGEATGINLQRQPKGRPSVTAGRGVSRAAGPQHRRGA